MRSNGRAFHRPYLVEALHLQLLAMNFYRGRWYDNSLRGKGSIDDGVNHPSPTDMATSVDSPSCAATLVNLHSPVVAVCRKRELISECGREHHAGEHSN